MTNANALAAVSIDANTTTGVIALVFGDGTGTNLHVSELPGNIREQAVFHGIKQKLVDAAAIPRNIDTGKSATVAEKKAAVMTVLERLLAGEWNRGREAGSGTGTGGLLHRALCRLYSGKMDAAAVTAWLDGKDKKAQADLRANPRIASVIADIKAEDASKKNPGASDDLLAELDGMGDEPEVAE